ncbi:MAG: hypothetical protein H7Y04_11540, partial [Verrucomicrobia bacterium]|nr:hypothetical protein [Cytophagales bacterium]
MEKNEPVSKPKILFVVNLPPPLHGASLMNEFALKSALLNTNFTISVINLTTAKNIDDLGSFSLTKVFFSLGKAFHILMEMLFFRPQLVYFTLAPVGFAFYRDAFFILLIKLFRKKIVFHLHGKGIEKSLKSNKIYATLAKMVFRNNFVICLAEKLTFDISNLVHTSKIFIVNNGVASTAEVTFTEKNQEFINILYLSNYVKSKGILDLIDAVAIISHQKKN